MADFAQQIRDKMAAAGLGEPTIRAFLRAAQQVREGATGVLPEADIDPVAELPRLDEVAAGDAPLHELAVIKLNGGLGTGMGLDKAKSLLQVKDGDCFLDFIARQILYLRDGGTAPAFYLMNSFSTQADTRSHLAKYADLADADGCIDFLQSQVPKIDPETLCPVSWAANPDQEWCPPGHGDLYPSLVGSGLLDALMARGINYLFVSNSDNLGASVDPRLLRHFAESGDAFLMEVAQRTPADRKGGHLARRRSDGHLLLRESAQCPDADSDSFQDVARHQFFNTNNLWLRLDALKAALDAHGGLIPLPLICNRKTVDPKDPDSPPVLQLESAMGAAIECFDAAGAIVVPRTRFAPVKTTADLLALRSDAYVVTEDHRLELAAERGGQPPVIDLDSKQYKLMAGFDAAFGAGAPSLRECTELSVQGPVRFAAGVRCRGAVRFENPGQAPVQIPAGLYENTNWRP